MSVMIQIRHVPEALHRTLKSRAALAGMSLSDYLLRDIRHSAEIPTPSEMHERLARLPPVVVSETPANAIRAERDSR